MGQNREKWIDVARGIGIIFVVLGHCKRPDIILKMIQCFHMPFFFLISGYLCNESVISTGKLICKKWRAYIVPYFRFAIINLAFWIPIQYIKTGGVALKKIILRYIIGIIYSRGTWYWMPNCSPIWFLTAIFCASIMMYGILRIKNRSVRIIVVVLCGALAYACCSLDFFSNPILHFADYRYERIKLIFNIDSALWGVPYMYIGYCLKKRCFFKRVSEIKNCFWLILVVLLLIAGLISGYMNPIPYMSMDSMICGNIVLSYISGLGISLALLLVIYKYVQGDLLAFLGRNTLFILGYNYLINYVVYYVWDKRFQKSYISSAWFVQFIIQLVCLVFLIWLKECVYTKMKNKYKCRMNE